MEVAVTGTYKTYTLRIMGPIFVSEHDEADLLHEVLEILADGALSAVEEDLNYVLPEGVYVKLDEN